MEEKVVFLSPSTQEFNVGYGDFGTEEYRMNRIADIVEELLKNQGYTVYRNNPDEKLSAAVRKSNEIGPDIHVAVMQVGKVIVHRDQRYLLIDLIRLEIS